MEALAIVIVLVFFWTQQILFTPKTPEQQKPKEAENLADALKKLLEAGIEVRNKS